MRLIRCATRSSRHPPISPGAPVEIDTRHSIKNIVNVVYADSHVESVVNPSDRYNATFAFGQYYGEQPTPVAETDYAYWIFPSNASLLQTFPVAPTAAKWKSGGSPVSPRIPRAP